MTCCKLSLQELLAGPVTMADALAWHVDLTSQQGTAKVEGLS